MTAEREPCRRQCSGCRLLRQMNLQRLTVVAEVDDHTRADAQVVPRPGVVADLVCRCIGEGNGLVRLAVSVRDDDGVGGDLRDRPFQLAHAAMRKKKLRKKEQRAEKKSSSVHFPERNLSSSSFSFRICSSSAGVSLGR